MALPRNAPPLAPTQGSPIYRLVVSAYQAKSKRFIWTIVDDSNKAATVQTSQQTFRSMEDAYTAGTGSLAYWRAKMQRTTPTVDLAQPQLPTVKKTGRAPQRSFKSSVYSRG